MAVIVLFFQIVMVTDRKLLYVARMFPGRAELLRVKTLDNLLGRESQKFNMYDYEKRCGRYFNWAMKKLRIPNPGYYIMNKDLVKKAVKIKPDIVWIDKGIHITARTLS